MNENKLRKEIYNYIRQATAAGLDVEGDQYESSVTFKTDDYKKYRLVLNYNSWNREQTFQVCRETTTKSYWENGMQSLKRIFLNFLVIILPIHLNLQI